MKMQAFWEMHWKLYAGVDAQNIFCYTKTYNLKSATQILGGNSLHIFAAVNGDDQWWCLWMRKAITQTISVNEHNLLETPTIHIRVLNLLPPTHFYSLFRHNKNIQCRKEKQQIIRSKEVSIALQTGYSVLLLFFFRRPRIHGGRRRTNTKLTGIFDIPSSSSVSSPLGDWWSIAIVGQPIHVSHRRVSLSVIFISNPLLKYPMPGSGRTAFVFLFRHRLMPVCTILLPTIAFSIHIYIHGMAQCT